MWRRTRGSNEPKAIRSSAAQVLTTARQHGAAARVLAEHIHEPGPIGFVAGHACELALKAYMVHRGDSITGIKKRYGHDLRRLLTAVSGVAVPEATAACVVSLARYHGPDQGLTVQASSDSPLPPPAKEIVDHVEALIAAIAEHIE